MEKITLTETQAVQVRDAIRAGNPTFGVYLLDRRTARSLYNKGLIDQPGYGAHLTKAGKDVAHQLKAHPQRRTFHVEIRHVAYRIQLAERPDAMSEDGHIGYQLPWPVIAYADGFVWGAHAHWCGSVTRVIGFQKDMAKQTIDLDWPGFLLDPQQAVGMYLVTSDKNGTWGTHDTAVSSVGTEPVPEERA